MKKILIYGFSGFDKFTQNPSKDLVNDLCKKRWPGTAVHQYIFRVSYSEVCQKIPKIMEAAKYDAVLGFGLSASTTHIRLEKRGENWHDSKMPDIEGRVIHKQAIMRGERGAHQSSLNLTKIKRDLLRLNIPTAISMSAGGYICNLSYYLFLHHIRKRQHSTNCLFVHIPFSSEIICRKKWDYPSFPRDVLTKAGELIMASVLRLK